MRLRLPGARAGVHGAVCGLAGVMAAGAVAATVHPGVYQGGSRKATRHMDIALQVLAGDHRANWRIDVFGPCQHSDDQLDRTVGTDAGLTPPDPQLRLHHGRFTLRRHATNPNDGLKYR